MLIAVVVLAAVGFGLVLLLRVAKGEGPEVTVADLPDGVAQLRERGGEHAYLVLLLAPEGWQPDDALSLQYSIEGGRLGLDWVLLGPANVAERARVEAFAAGRGQPLHERQVNGVRYLRTEEGDLAALGLQLVGELYGMGPTARMGTIVEGFSWRPGGR